MTRMKDVAREAGVSAFVVSKVLNDGWREVRIAPACAERVLAVAKRLDYTPNHQARVFRSGRTGAIGLVLPADRLHTNPGFNASLIDAVESVVSSRRHDLMLMSGSDVQDEIEHGLDQLRQRRVDALIVPGTLGPLARNAAFASASGPIVV